MEPQPPGMRQYERATVPGPPGGQESPGTFILAGPVQEKDKEVLLRRDENCRCFKADFFGSPYALFFTNRTSDALSGCPAGGKRP